MANWVNWAPSPVLWSCTVPGCSVGNYLDDEQGRQDHAASAGHTPRPGRPLCPVLGVSDA
jgi:hypothetical protein